MHVGRELRERSATDYGCREICVRGGEGLNRQVALSVQLREEYTAQCMRESGFDYRTTPAPKVVRPGTEANNSEVVGWGFVQSLESGSKSPELPPPTGKFTSATEEAAYQQALVAPDGCSQTARDQAHEESGLADWDQFQPSYEQALQAWEARPEVVTALKRWSSCLSEAGFSKVQNDQDISEVMLEAWATEGAAAIELERALHTANQACPQPIRPSVDFLIAEMGN